MAATDATAAAVGEQLADVADLVRRMCVARLGVDDGADAAQEAMVRFWRAVQRPEFRVEGLHRYAAAVARYEVMRAFGTRDRHRHTRLGDAGEQVIADPAPALAERVEQRLDAADAVAALAQVLSPGQRTAHRGVVRGRGRIFHYSWVWLKPDGLLNSDDIADQLADIALRGQLVRDTEPAEPVGSNATALLR